MPLNHAISAQLQSRAFAHLSNLGGQKQLANGLHLHRYESFVFTQSVKQGVNESGEPAQKSEIACSAVAVFAYLRRRAGP